VDEMETQKTKILKTRLGIAVAIADIAIANKALVELSKKIDTTFGEASPEIRAAHFRGCQWAGDVESQLFGDKISNRAFSMLWDNF
jgi:hypothetical protein